MKKYSFLYITLFFVLILSACKKETSGDNVLEGTFTVPYADATFDNEVIDAPPRDTTLAVRFILRRAVNQATTVSYSIAGIQTLANQTITIPAQATSASKVLSVAAGTSGDIVVTVTKAVFADNTVLRLGGRGKTDVSITRTMTLE